MGRVLGTCIALVLFVLLAYPFGRDAYHRYEVSRRLDAVMNDSDRAAFRNWNGDAASFSRALYDRCVREQQSGRAATNCDSYRIAFE